MDQFCPGHYRSFREFFLREKKERTVDPVPDHLVSPCDGWLSACPVGENRQFFLKGSCYRISDLIRDRGVAEGFSGGLCLVFRLCASDYHHYCFIDDGIQKSTQFIEGQLHSVQPIACETFPVFSLNRRVWSLLETRHFGPVVQTEIGALVVGGIVNRNPEGPFRRGQEKGRFELSGSTVVLFFEQNRVTLEPEIREALEQNPEVRVELGQWIGERSRDHE